MPAGPWWSAGARPPRPAARPASACAPSASTTTAATASPHSSSGTPSTATSATRGMRRAARLRSRRARGSRRRARSRRRGGPRRRGSPPRPASRRRWWPASRRRTATRPCAEVFAGDLLAAHTDLAVAARPGRHALGSADLDLEGGQRAARPSPAGAAPSGRSSRCASRWSSGPSTAMVELVSVSP